MGVVDEEPLPYLASLPNGSTQTLASLSGSSGRGHNRHGAHELETPPKAQAVGIFCVAGRGGSEGKRRRWREVSTEKALRNLRSEIRLAHPGRGKYRRGRWLEQFHRKQLGACWP